MTDTLVTPQKIYTISIRDMVDIWVESFHKGDHVIIIHDALKHVSVLAELGFNIDHSKLYNNKILSVTVSSIDDALTIVNSLPIEKSPYVQVYSLGEYITDNIDK